MRLLDFHLLVETDLTEAVVWYDSQSTGLGGRWLGEVMAVFRRLPEEALLYSIRFADIRRMNLPGFPYGVFYFVTGNQTVVLAVMHAARDSQAELTDRRNEIV